MIMDSISIFCIAGSNVIRDHLIGVDSHIAGTCIDLGTEILSDLPVDTIVVGRALVDAKINTVVMIQTIPPEVHSSMIHNSDFISDFLGFILVAIGGFAFQFITILLIVYLLGVFTKPIYHWMRSLFYKLLDKMS